MTKVLQFLVQEFRGQPMYLDLDWPGEVADVDVEGDVGVGPEGELLTGEAFPELLDVVLGHNVHLLPRYGPS